MCLFPRLPADWSVLYSEQRLLEASVPVAAATYYEVREAVCFSFSSRRLLVCRVCLALAADLPPPVLRLLVTPNCVAALRVCPWHGAWLWTAGLLNLRTR